MLPPDDDGPEIDIRWRGRDVSRLEGVSDAVFALALTLVLLSGGVPTRLSELRLIFEQIIPFAICFCVIGMIWHAHYLFFRRYGLRDGIASLLNGVLMFLVLLFAYPLKLLFAMISQALFGFGATLPLRELADVDFPILPIYSLGFGAIYSVLALLYRHAWRRRDKLGLDELERAVTRQYEQSAWILVAFATTSLILAVALPGRWQQIAGWMYFGIGPVMTVHAIKWQKSRERLRESALVARLGVGTSA